MHAHLFIVYIILQVTKKDRFTCWITHYNSNASYRHTCATLSVSGKHLVTNADSDSNWAPGTKVGKVFKDIFYEGEVIEQYEVEDTKDGKKRKFQC